MELQHIIASSCRQKILSALSKTKSTHVTNLVRIINSTYNQVDRNLRILEQEGIIENVRYSRVRIIRLNFENPKTLALLKALEMLDRPIPSLKKVTGSKFK
jgi:DeoR/GlpR family transcriptional regulator of sugar metabolism